MHLAAHRAIDETDRLGRLVEGLLTLARTEGHQAATVEMDAAEVMRTRHDAWRPVTDDRDVTSRLDVPPLPIGQALDNLIANAVDVAPTGSVITLAARRVPYGVDLHVIDQGPGMTEEQ